MNVKSLTLGIIFIVGQGLTQLGLFSLVFVNTNWGVNGLGAGSVILTIGISGPVSFFCGSFLASSQFYQSTLAKTIFSLIVSLFFLFMLTLERMYGNIVDDQGVGNFHLMPVMYISILVACWLFVQMTRRQL